MCRHSIMHHDAFSNPITCSMTIMPNRAAEHEGAHKGDRPLWACSVIRIVLAMIRHFLCCFQAKGQLQWSLPEGYQLQFDSLANELYIGGVYVRLFLKNPKFSLRAPKVCPTLM